MAALRRLMKAREEENLVGEEEEEEEEDILSEENVFDLLGEEDEEEEEEEDRSSPSPPPPVVREKRDEFREAKKKKKKRKPVKEVDGDDIDALVEELGLEVRGKEPLEKSKEVEGGVWLESVLKMTWEDFNPKHEMKKRFGAAAVRAISEEGGSSGGRRSRGRGRKRKKKTLLVRFADTWPEEGGCSLDMEVLRNHDGDEGLCAFAFTHSRSYDHVQQQFLLSLMSHDPEMILGLLLDHPYHVDSLLQMAEVYKMQQQPERAAEFVSRAVWTFERAFHPRFHPLEGDCRVPYAGHPGNWSFYVALFRHVQMLERTNALRTCLEVCKLMLALDPTHDPVGALFWMDYFALRSVCTSRGNNKERKRVQGEEMWLWRLSKEFSARDVTILPNIAFGAALAAHRMEREGKTCPEKEGWDANGLLRLALLRFPIVLGVLLDKCSGVEGQEAAIARCASCSYFRCTYEAPVLDHLIILFLERCAGLWKDPAVMGWLESVLKNVCSEVERGESVSPKCVSMELYRTGVPHNLYRHILLSDCQPAISTLPANIRVIPANMYDHHLRAAAEKGSSGTGSSGSLVGEFLRSMMPWHGMNAPQGGQVDWQATAGALLANFGFVQDQQQFEEDEGEDSDTSEEGHVQRVPYEG